MMIVSGNSVANYFAKDLCAAAARGFELLQREQGRAFAQHHARSIGIEGSTFFRRCCLQRIKANEYEFGQGIVASSQNALVAASANSIEGMTNCVRAGGAGIGDN